MKHHELWWSIMNLHSIMVGFNPSCFDIKDGIIIIYIPLWSDSIANRRRQSMGLAKFTFHYGRIQSPMRCRTQRNAWHLHSIMVGFNLHSISASSISGSFTFHYGRIQSHLRLFSRILYANLHSIMVGFNRAVFVVCRVRLIHLHSIMVGFNQQHSERRSARFKNLHSIMVGFNPLVFAEIFVVRWIYIPLWSDSIGLRKLNEWRTIWFTFHYGRIQSTQKEMAAIITEKFTFHYGRIQSSRSAGWDTGVYWFTFHYGRIQSCAGS